MSRAPRIALLVLSSAAAPWERIEAEGQVPTWGADAEAERIPVVRYRGASGPRDRRYGDWTKRLARTVGPAAAARLAVRAATTAQRGRYGGWDGQVLEVPTPEVKVMLAPKLHLALRWLLEVNDFDLVFRTNSSTYVNVPALRTLAGRFAGSGVYAGVRGEEVMGGSVLPYAAGMGVLMSRDVVSAVVRSGGLLTTHVDDVALGMACRRLGFEVTAIERGDAHTLEQAEEMPIATLRRVAFVRCKSELPRERRADLEVRIMRTLHERLRADRTRPSDVRPALPEPGEDPVGAE